MHISADTTFLIACLAYLLCLFGALWLHRARRWKIARYVLALLIFLPSLLIMSSGLGLFGTSLYGGYRNPGGRFDASAVVDVIATIICVLGMTLACFAVRLVTNPWRQKRMSRSLAHRT